MDVELRSDPSVPHMARRLHENRPGLDDVSDPYVMTDQLVTRLRPLHYSVLTDGRPEP